jgi:pimeloyl-ACP methyl ester carboxylesterase
MDLFCHEFGEGQPLLILHGLLGISDNWVSFGKRISDEGFRVIIPDQRNHGRSPHHRIFNYYALVDDLVEFMEAKDIRNPVVMGHSMGGKVAMRYTLENPGLVKKIVVVDTSLRTYVRFNYHQELIDAMLSVDLSGVSSRAEVEPRLAKTIKSERLRQFLIKNLYWNTNDQLDWRSNLEAIHNNLESMYDGVFYSTRYEGPALFVRGAESDYVVEEDIPAIKQNFPNAQIETIPEGTHWVHADNPELFYDIVGGFLMESK